MALCSARGLSALVAVVVALGLTSCFANDLPEPAGTVAVADEHFEGFEACDGLPVPWLCATVEVPLDRDDEDAGTIGLRVLGIPHSDTSVAEGLPMFETPGGPGDPAMGYALWQLPSLIREHHDVVAIDPRGAGMSAAIDCPALQDGAASFQQLYLDSDECGRQLGTTADLYGGPQRAMDVDAVREVMGYDRIILHGTSYGGVDVQAYASRFPDRLAAAMIDGGFVVDDVDMLFGTDVAAGIIQVIDTACRADGECAASTEDPAGVVSEVVRRLGASPTVEGGVVVIDEASIASLVRDAGLPVEVVAASLRFLEGDTAPMAVLVRENHALVIPPGGPVEEFSFGANAAGWCNDQAFPFDLDAAPAQRQAELDRAVAELGDDAFAPWSVQGWQDFWVFGQCVGWPPPRNHEPVLEGDIALPGILALLTVGDRDPAVASAAALNSRFPDGTTVVVPGAAHPPLSFGLCVAEFEAQFIETLKVPAEVPCADG